MYFNGTKCCSVIFCCIMSLSLAAKDVKTATETQGLRKPLCFVENKGQVVDENNHPRTDVQYKLSTPGMSMYVSNGKLIYQFKKIEGSSAADLKFTDYRMDVTLLGANKNAMAVSAEKQVYTENYYLSQLEQKGFSAHSYNRVIYKNVYRNIDWVLYVKDDKVEYDFVVRPGGNVNDIQIKYDGATALNVTKDGGIAAETPMGKVEEKSPYAYETTTGKAVASKFVLKNNIISFKTDAYKGSLTIDPWLQWSTYFGGGAEDVFTSVQVNSTGTFVCGYSATGGRIIAAGETVFPSFHTTNAGGAYDAFIAKYTNTPGSDGKFIWATYYGGSGNDQGMAIALDNPSNSVYLTGFTTSTTGITGGGVVGTHQPAKSALNDGFLVKFNSNTGTPTWATYFGGTGDDYCNAVACDGSGNVYISGKTASTTGIANVLTSAFNGGTDAFIAKFDGTGTIQWGRYFGGAANDEALAMTCDNTNSIIITGKTSSITGIATPGAYQGTLNGFDDAFIAKFNTLGTQLWGTYFGGPGEETGNGIAIDPSNNFAIVGNTSSSSGVASSRAYQPVYNTDVTNTQDAFVAYFNNAGAPLWSTYYGGEQPDYGQGVCFDAFNNIVITGATFSTTGIYTINGSPQNAISGSYDAFLAKLTPLGQVIWGTYFGGTFYDFANAVACNTTTDQVAIAGFTASDGGQYQQFGGTGISKNGTDQPFYNGGVYDAFAVLFRKDTFLLIDQPFVDTLVCSGGTLNVSFSVYSPGVAFLPGNLFQVQLSDAFGGFTSPTVIGTGLTSPIACTIPSTPGAGYRIRIIGNSPAYTSNDDFYDITISGPTLPAPVVAASSPVCLGNNLFLYTSALYPISGYDWSGPDGFFSSLPDPVRLSVTYADSGVYTVITAHNGCPPDTSSVDVAINNSTPPTPTDSTGITCDGNNLYLFANSGVAGSSYFWTGPGGFSSTEQNPVIAAATFTNTGTYVVRDTVLGCQSLNNTLTVTVLPLMPTSSSITANVPYIPGAPGDTICLGTLVSFTASTVNGGFSPQYQWYSGPSYPVVGAVSSTWESSTLLNGETIYCMVTSSLSCPLPATTTSNIIKMNVIDNPPLVYIASAPTGSVSPGTHVTFTSAVYNGGIGPLYQWKLNHADVPGATNSTFTTTVLTVNDTVTLSVASTMMCAVPNTGNSNIIIMETNVGVSSVAAPLNNVALYPNPNSGTFTVKGNVTGINNSAVSIEILNAIGQVIYSGNAAVQNDQLDKTIDLQNIPDGIYLLHISEQDQSKTFRFSIQH